MKAGPQRIVCLSAETVDLLYRLGAGDQVVGVSGYTVFPPEARKKPFVSAFTSIRHEVIDELKPDLILAYSDLQADAAAELGKKGYPVVLTNQHSLTECFETFALIGRIVGRAQEADALIADLKQRLEAARRRPVASGRRPRVFFEEWDEPLISGIGWIDDLIRVAGGDPVFPELTKAKIASERIVSPAAVAAAAPDIVIASWCGRKAKLARIRARPGWGTVPAVCERAIFEVKSAYCLQPGPALIAEGLPRFIEIIDDWRTRARETA